MKFLFPALVICFTALNLTAQKITFEKGYLVNENGDTLRGEVKYNPKKEQDCYTKVIFKDENGIQKNYKANKAKAYGFNDRNYVSMEFEGEPRFYKVLASGDINLYKMVVEEIDMNEAVLGGEYYISHKPDETKLTEVKESKFKKQIMEWMTDNTEFVNDYDDDKFLNESDAATAIKKYNAWKAAKLE